MPSRSRSTHRKPAKPHPPDRIERRTLAWLRTYGIGRDADEQDKLRKFNCAMYGGYSLPVADFESALLVTQFICLWLFWDDMLVEEELAWDIDEIVRALTDDAPPTSDSRYVAAWADIGRRLRRTRSREWLRRLGVTMRQWMENAKVETCLARAFKRGTCPEFAAAFECRTVSIGMYPTFHLIEHAGGDELPARVVSGVERRRRAQMPKRQGSSGSTTNVGKPAHSPVWSRACATWSSAIVSTPAMPCC